MCSRNVSANALYHYFTDREALMMMVMQAKTTRNCTIVHMRTIKRVAGKISKKRGKVGGILSKGVK